MLPILGYIADAMWVVVMAVIASTSRGALRRIPAGTKVPMQWSVAGSVNWRARRGLAFGFMIGLPLVVGLIFMAVSRLSAEPDQALIIFLVRAFTAPVFALVHIVWLQSAIRTLDAEGSLKP